MNKETTRKPGKKTGFFQSMRFRLLLCVLLSAVIVGGIMMVIVIPASISTMKSVTKNYVYDLTNLTGQELQQAVDAAGFEIAKQELPQIAGAVSIRDVESSYCYIMDNNGTILYHPQTDKIGQTIDNAHIEEMIKKLQAGSKPSTEVISYVDNGVQEYSACYINPTSEFIVVITADEAEIISPVNSMISKTIVGAILALIICLLVATIVISILLRPLGKINQEVARFATMDFTNSDDMQHLSKHKDEIGSMGMALNELRQKLVSAVQVLQDQSQKLYRASKQLQAESMEAANVIDQVDSAVHDIADGATSQANETQSATENVLIIGSMIEQSNSNIQEIRGNSEQINESATVVTDTLSQLTQINTQVKKAIDAIYQQTHTTNDSATKIKEAATLITSIAEETNLLSLNASIEAARAGEHGKGFAVVANQIQKLAEQSNESANQIEGIISELIDDSDRTVATMEEVREVVEQQDLSVKKTDEIFRTVRKGINSSIDAIEKVSSDTAKMDRARINITDTVQNLTAIAEENAASTQETSASATQVRTAVDTISESASSLNEIALELEETMSQFKI